MIDDNAFQNLLTAKVKTLPIEVLRSIQRVVSAELDRRRFDHRAAKRMEFLAAQKNGKLIGHNRGTSGYVNGWLGYLHILLEQDWSHLFSGDATPKYYVYIHSLCFGRYMRFVHPRCTIKTKGMPFYVGKGTGDRAYDLKRNQGHGATLKQLLDGGFTPQDIVSIVQDKLTEPQALELESKLIYFFGTKYEKGRAGILVNLDIPPRPNFEIELKTPELQELHQQMMSPARDFKRAA